MTNCKHNERADSEWGKDADSECGKDATFDSLENIGLNDGTINTLCGIYKAIGEPSRLKIILALMQGDMCVYHISEKTGLKQSLTSHQLRVLRARGIIKSRRDGQLIIYGIADEHIKSIIQMSLVHLNCI